MILLGTHATGALVYYLREGSFTHAGCSASAQVQVSVRIAGIDEPNIESDESWTCEVCGFEDTGRDPAVHATLADALRRLPPPPPGELDVDDLAAQMLQDIARTRAEDAARV